MSLPNKITKGFTLIELLVVIVILATLAAGVLYSTDNARDKAKDSVRKQDLSAIASALVAYYADHNQYPPTDQNNITLDYSSDQNLPDWIPDVAPYLNGTPKDPLQASKSVGSVAATVTTTVVDSKDDAKRLTPPNSVPFQNTVTDNPIGHPFNCSETRNSYMRFTNVQIPKNAVISEARINFEPRNDSGPGDNTANGTNPADMRTKFTAELSVDAQQIPNPNISPLPNGYNDWTNRTRTSSQIIWNNIPRWHPTPTNTNDLRSPNIGSIIQELVNQSSWSQTPRAINIFWEDNGSTNCAGRVAVSADGEEAGLGNAPELSITWNPAPSPSPTPSPTPTTSPTPTPGPTPPISSPIPTIGACDNKIEIYCYRVSLDKKKFILWAQLENINDPEIFNHPLDAAVCNNNDPAVAPPTGSNLNYCVKSPPN